MSVRGTRAVGLIIGLTESTSITAKSFLLFPDLCFFPRLMGFLVVFPSSVSWVSSGRADDSVG